MRLHIQDVNAALVNARASVGELEYQLGRSDLESVDFDPHSVDVLTRQIETITQGIRDRLLGVPEEIIF